MTEEQFKTLIKTLRGILAMLMICALLLACIGVSASSSIFNTIGVLLLAVLAILVAL